MEVPPHGRGGMTVRRKEKKGKDGRHERRGDFVLHCLPPIFSILSFFYDVRRHSASDEGAGGMTTNPLPCIEKKCTFAGLML